MNTLMMIKMMMMMIIMMIIIIIYQMYKCKTKKDSTKIRHRISTKNKYVRMLQ